MARIRTQKYSKEEIKQASHKVMRSLNMLNQKPLKFTPQISNSVAKAEISKSAERRRKRRERANLAGKSMDSLLDGLETVDAPKPKHTGYIDPHKSSKNNKRVFDNEIANYKTKVGRSLSDIRKHLAAAHAHGANNDSPAPKF